MEDLRTATSENGLYRIRLSHNFEIPSISNEKPISIETLGCFCLL